MARLKTVKVESDNKQGFMIINECDMTADHVLCEGEVMEAPLKVAGESECDCSAELDEATKMANGIIAEHQTKIAELIKENAELAEKLKASESALAATKADSKADSKGGEGKTEGGGDKKPAGASKAAAGDKK